MNSAAAAAAHYDVVRDNISNNLDRLLREIFQE
jgi:hypothetical protein